MTQRDSHFFYSSTYATILFNTYLFQILTTIVETFDTFEEQHSSAPGPSSLAVVSGGPSFYNQLLQAQGTVFLHLNFACLKNNFIGSEFIKLFKARRFNLSPFCFASLLAILRVPRHKDACLSALGEHAHLYFTSLAQRQNRF
jgi:hypothetical protein